MGTPQHINTIVNGSVGMLQEAARALRSGEGAAAQADDAHHAARNTAHAEWEGEGGAAFLDHLEPHLNYTRDLVKTCTVYAKAFDDLAGEIESVNNDMEKVLSTARSGGLDVHGPIVLRPEGPGGPPNAAQYRGEGGAVEYKADRSAYQAKVADFNAKAQTFNTCLEIYKKARDKEGQAHTEFWEALDPKRGFGLDSAWNIGTTTASYSLTTIGAMDNARSGLLAKLNGLESSSQTYQMLAAGRVSLAGMSAKQRMQVMKDLARSKADEVSYRRQITQLNKLGKPIPDGLTKLATANPGQLVPNSKIGKVLGKLPWAGSILTAGNEALGAATGEQSWGKAVARVGGTLGGGWAVGTAGAALCAPVAPPAGSIVCSVAGVGLGAFSGNEVVDVIVPEESDVPEPVSTMPTNPSPPSHGGQ